MRRKRRQRRFSYQEAARLYVRSAYAHHCTHYYTSLVDHEAARLALLGDDISLMDVPYWPRNAPFDQPVSNPGRDWSRQLGDMLATDFRGFAHPNASFAKWCRRIRRAFS